MSRAFRESGLVPDEARRFCDIDGSKEPSLTVQADRNEVDINRIVARIERGLAVPVLQGEPFYGDVSTLGGLQEAIMKVQEAQELFMQYPAEVREKFENDPVKFVSFFEDEKNREEAEKLGLVEKRPKAENKASEAQPDPSGGK